MIDFSQLSRRPKRAPEAPAGAERTEPADASTVARKILGAAAVRDAGGPTLAQPTGVAAKIIAAGKKRRNEES